MKRAPLFQACLRRPIALSFVQSGAHLRCLKIIGATLLTVWVSRKHEAGAAVSGLIRRGSALSFVQSGAHLRCLKIICAPLLTVWVSWKHEVGAAVSGMIRASYCAV